MLEKQIEKKVCDYAKSNGFLTYKFSSPAHAAVPDRIFITPQGQIIFIEFKRMGCKLTCAQDRERHRLLEHNCAYRIVDNVEHGCKIVDFWKDF